VGRGKETTGVCTDGIKQIHKKEDFEVKDDGDKCVNKEGATKSWHVSKVKLELITERCGTREERMKLEN